MSSSIPKPRCCHVHIFFGLRSRHHGDEATVSRKAWDCLQCPGRIGSEPGAGDLPAFFIFFQEVTQSYVCLPQYSLLGVRCVDRRLHNHAVRVVLGLRALSLDEKYEIAEGSNITIITISTGRQAVQVVQLTQESQLEQLVHLV